MCVRGMEMDVKKTSTCGILKNKYEMIVTYWPSTEPSIKRCTCVNKQRNSRNRCIRSRMSYHLDLWTWLNSGQMCTPTGSRWAWSNYITRCHRWLGSVGVPVAVGDKMPAWEQLADWGLATLRTHGWAA